MVLVFLAFLGFFFSSSIDDSRFCGSFDDLILEQIDLLVLSVSAVLGFYLENRILHAVTFSRVCEVDRPWISALRSSFSYC